MPNIRTLSVSLKAKTGKFSKAMKAASSRLVTFGRQVTSVAKQTAKYTAGLAAAGAAATAFFVKQQLGAIDALAKTADKLGLTTEALAGLRHAANLTGVSTKQLDTGIQRMTRRIAEAAQGSGTAKSALEELGLNAQQLARMSPDEQFKAIADAMQQVGSQSDRVRLGFKLFDAEGVGLINTLNGGSAAVQAMADEAEALGLALNRVDAAKVEQTNDAVDRAGKAFMGLVNGLTVALAPTIKFVADSFTAFVKNAISGSNSFIKTIANIAKAAVKVGSIFLDWRLVFSEIKTGFLNVVNFIVNNLATIANKIADVLEYFGLENAAAGLRNVANIGTQVAQQLVDESAAQRDALRDRAAQRLLDIDKFFEGFEQAVASGLQGAKPPTIDPDAFDPLKEAVKEGTEAGTQAANEDPTPAAQQQQNEANQGNIQQLSRFITAASLGAKSPAERANELLAQIISQFEKARNEARNNQAAVFA